LLPGSCDGSSLPAGMATPTREQELEWLKSYPREPVSASELIQPALKLVIPLAQALGVSVEHSLPENLPRPVVQLTTVRQALSNVITAAVRAAPHGRVSVSAEAGAAKLVISIRAFILQPGSLSSTPLTRGRLGAGSPLTADDLDNLEMARRMVGFSDGLLEVRVEESKGSPLVASIELPAVAEVNVLVIDDNADTRQLLQRYLEGTPYRFIGAGDPDRALALAADVVPRVIVLDVMLPGMDGWELLGRLREHPRTRGVPIIVCTILAQEQLALALGAAAFLRKPVNREAFLAALEQQVDRQWRASG